MTADEVKRYYDATECPVLMQCRDLPPHGILDALFLPARRLVMDVRRFVSDDDDVVQGVLRRHGLEADVPAEVLADRCEDLVRKLVRYTPDGLRPGREHWQFPAETLALRCGDCEDGAILLCTMLLCLMPADEAWRVMVQVGEGTTGPRDQGTKGPKDQKTTGPRDQGTGGPRDQKTTGPRDWGTGRGHAFVRFWRCDGEFVRLDWTLPGAMDLMKRWRLEDDAAAGKARCWFNHRSAHVPMGGIVG